MSKFNFPIDTKEYKVLTKEEERAALFEFRFSMDETIRKVAKDTLVCHNMGLVYKIIKDLTKNDRFAEPDTLVSYGVEGLIIAINKFDLSRDTKLSTYAHAWVSKYVRRGIHEQTPVRMPEGMWEKVITFQRVQNEIKAMLGREPSYKPFSIDGFEFSEMEDALVNGDYNFTPDSYKRTVEAWNYKNIESLNATMEGDKGNAVEYIDTIEDVEGTKRAESDRRIELMRTEFEKVRYSGIKDANKVADVLIYMLDHLEAEEAEVIEALGLKGREELRTLRRRGFAWLKDNSVDLTLQYMEI